MQDEWVVRFNAAVAFSIVVAALAILMRVVIPADEVGALKGSTDQQPGAVLPLPRGEGSFSASESTDAAEEAFVPKPRSTPPPTPTPRPERTRTSRHDNASARDTADSRNAASERTISGGTVTCILPDGSQLQLELSVCRERNGLVYR